MSDGISAPVSPLEPFHRMALAILRRVVDEGREEDIGINTTAVVINAVDVLKAEVERLDEEATEILLPLVTWLLDHEADRYGGRHCIDVAIELLDERTTQRDLARDVAVQLEQEVAQLVRERDQDAADLRAATADLKARLDSIVEEHRRRTIGTFCLSCMGACRFADDEGGE